MASDKRTEISQKWFEATPWTSSLASYSTWEEVTKIVDSVHDDPMQPLRTFYDKASGYSDGRSIKINATGVPFLQATFF
jgi:hypothetical protein